jgi:hypothetical protein
MNAYSRIQAFLRELGAECVCELEGPTSRFSEWRLGTHAVALRVDASGGLRLYRLANQSAAGRPDIIMDAVVEMCMPGGAAAA